MADNQHHHLQYRQQQHQQHQPDQNQQCTKNPESLYEISLSSYIGNLNNKVSTLNKYELLRTLPMIVLTDIYERMSNFDQLRDFLFTELTDINVFYEILKFGISRQNTLRFFSTMMTSRRPLAENIAKNYTTKSEEYYKNDICCSCNCDTINDFLKQIDCGLRIGSFMAEAGWLQQSIHILSATLKLIKLMKQDYNILIIKLDCLQRLLHAQAGFCCFKDADRTFKDGNDIIDTVGIDELPKHLLANWYTRVSVLHFAKSEYDMSYVWSLKSLENVDYKTPNKTTIDVLRQAAKSCILKRQFKKAHILLVHAVKMAKHRFGRQHQKYADALLDYGFFLLNVDSIVHSVNVYEDALNIKRSIFGDQNLHVAIAEEDLSYALYVCEYSSGQFESAKNHVEKAIYIMRELMPSNHLLLASAKRVKALILEEIALDHAAENPVYTYLLDDAEELHQFALQLTLETFGQNNVQTAKHYGNLGRLYQSMTKYYESEVMHQRAIKIKSEILGPWDYEVGLSLGHLASLYNYHMNKHREAEKLYMRSIDISLKLFGKSYSGLEYDYRGLCHVYEYLGDIDKYFEYQSILESWKILREEREDDKSLMDIRENSTLEEVTQKFFDLCTEKPSSSSTSSSSTSSPTSPSS